MHAIGGRNLQSEREAQAFAESLRPVMTELARLSDRAAAMELNRRKIATPLGALWHNKTVRRLRDRLEGREPSP